MREPISPGLSDEEVQRYSRQLLLAGFREPQQLRLRAATAVVVGCGGLGTAAALYLVGAGVGRVRLCDGDIVSLDNLHRQVAFRERDIGRDKAEALAAQLRELNREVAAEPRNARLKPRDLDGALTGADLVLECSDDPETKFAVNDWCVRQGANLVVAGAIGWRGQVLAVSPGGPCYRCLFHDVPQGAEVSCRTAGVAGPVVGAVGSMQALIGMRILARLEPSPPSGRLLDLDATTLRWRAVHFERDPACVSHVP